MHVLCVFLDDMEWTWDAPHVLIAKRAGLHQRLVCTAAPTVPLAMNDASPIKTPKKLALESGLHLHIYGKASAKTGRKMGHTNQLITP